MVHDIEYALKMSVINYCEDMCPYRVFNASYEMVMNYHVQ